jgi:hypothetical protein
MSPLPSPASYLTPSRRTDEWIFNRLPRPMILCIIQYTKLIRDTIGSLGRLAWAVELAGRRSAYLEISDPNLARLPAGGTLKCEDR